MQEDADGDGIGDECDPDYDADKLDLEECRANTNPLLWAKKCEGKLEKVGCMSAPGRPSGEHGWWLLMGVLALRRRRR